MNIQEFDFNENLHYTERTAVYALIENRSRISVVLSKKSQLFLPGGGVENNETNEEAITRELWEECGRKSRIIAKQFEAIQYFEAKDEGINFMARMTFYVCEFTSEVLQKGEHTFQWRNPNSNFSNFCHESHVWAINNYVRVRA